MILSLPPSGEHAAPSADNDLQYLVELLRRVWPQVPIAILGPSNGFDLDRLVVDGLMEASGPRL